MYITYDNKNKQNYLNKIYSYVLCHSVNSGNVLLLFMVMVKVFTSKNHKYDYILEWSDI